MTIRTQDDVAFESQRQFSEFREAFLAGAAHGRKTACDVLRLIASTEQELVSALLHIEALPWPVTVIQTIEVTVKIPGSSHKQYFNLDVDVTGLNPDEATVKCDKAASDLRNRTEISWRRCL